MPIRCSESSWLWLRWCSLITISMVKHTKPPNNTMMVLMPKSARIISAYSASISRMFRFSLKFCTAIE